MAYGLEVFDDDGTTAVLSPGNRFGNVLAAADINIANGVTFLLQCDMTGVTTSNSSVSIFGNNIFTSTSAMTITRQTSGAVNTQGFNITNNAAVAITGTAVAVRW